MGNLTLQMHLVPCQLDILGQNKYKVIVVTSRKWKTEKGGQKVTAAVATEI